MLMHVDMCADSFIYRKEFPVGPIGFPVGPTSVLERVFPHQGPFQLSPPLSSSRVPVSQLFFTPKHYYYHLASAQPLKLYYNVCPAGSCIICRTYRSTKALRASYRTSSAIGVRATGTFRPHTAKNKTPFLYSGSIP